MVRASALKGAAVGIVADRLLGEGGLDPHPVALFGRTMQAVEGHLYRDRRGVGAVHALAGVAVAAVSAPVVPVAVATWVAVAGRMLADTATAVGDALDDGDVARARDLLPGLVGRDPRHLDEPEICRAVVESVAENTVDAVVAPGLWAGCLGAGGAFVARAVDTLDSMVGHRSPRYARYGWASARLDDAVAWLPARVTAALVAAVRPATARAVACAVRRDAPAHPSPNAGVAEAAFAAALGLRLGGANRYGDVVEHRPALGQGRPPARPDIARAVRLSRDVTLALAATLAATGVVLDRRRHHAA